MPLDHQDLFGAPAAIRQMPIERNAEFSPDERYRYTLGRRWADGGQYAVWIGCNPSLADTTRDDPTILREMHFSRAWGYRGMVKVNLYPVITPNMKACNEWIASIATNPGASAAAMENARRILQVARDSDAGLVMAAWGAIVTDLEWAESIATAIKRPLYCLSTTASGAPKHPMARGVHRVPDDQQPMLWWPRDRSAVGASNAEVG